MQYTISQEPKLSLLHSSFYTEIMTLSTVSLEIKIKIEEKTKFCSTFVGMKWVPINEKLKSIRWYWRPCLVANIQEMSNFKNDHKCLKRINPFKLFTTKHCWRWHTFKKCQSTANINSKWLWMFENDKSMQVFLKLSLKNSGFFLPW